ncbi:MAG: DUF5107 domain-containing protein [Anaerolineae bacterium]
MPATLPASPTPMPSATLSQPPAPIATATATGTPTPQLPPVTLALPPVRVSTGTWGVQAYPFGEHLQRVASEEVPGFSFLQLDWEAYRAGEPKPVPVEFPSLTLENRWLRITVVPALGGRVVEMTLKSTGHNELYQNPVLKPTMWGPPEQRWWLAAGGMEWCLPVPEHGYLWAEPWEGRTEEGLGEASVVVRSPEGLPLVVQIVVRLSADEAALHLEFRIRNQTQWEVPFSYWTNAMLAPGGGLRPSPELRFVLPQDQVVVHSTGDPRLPQAGQVTSWAQWGQVRLDRLGDWEGWLGFFAYPQAKEGFAGVYDPEADEGVVRVFPPETARGLKGFAFGYGSRSPSADEWTDDGSAYVELHGGLAPTFDDQVSLRPGEEVAWEEVWYPVAGLGALAHAAGQVAVGLRPAEGGDQLVLWSTRKWQGTLLLSPAGGRVGVRQEVSLTPEAALRLPLDENVLGPEGPVEIRLMDGAGEVMYAYTLERDMPD